MAHYGTLWYSVAHCGTLWHTVANCGKLRHTMAYYGILWYTMVYYGILLILYIATLEGRVESGDELKKIGTYSML